MCIICSPILYFITVYTIVLLLALTALQRLPQGGAQMEIERGGGSVHGECGGARGGARDYSVHPALPPTLRRVWQKLCGIARQAGTLPRLIAIGLRGQGGTIAGQDNGSLVDTSRGTSSAMGLAALFIECSNMACGMGGPGGGQTRLLPDSLLSCDWFHGTLHLLGLSTCDWFHGPLHLLGLSTCDWFHGPLHLFGLSTCDWFHGPCTFSACRHAIGSTALYTFSACRHSIGSTALYTFSACRHAIGSTALYTFSACRHAIGSTALYTFSACRHAIGYIICACLTHMSIRHL